ncbi:MAG: glycogen synthase [Proteobacteria bacterium]|nr:glycogen synthase [Pseudomonadota bacterium]MBU1584398.1 glycogen synthase [Pseudomonadota bacterium]MBU2455807.1 glycogen synthase [Pseudomonadota bacterium]MBU2628263.1 glycogen synthase [Pseudomonadota bacterium]
MKILFIVSEIEGIVKTGGLADFARALPWALKKMHHDVRVVMPKYRAVQYPGLEGSWPLSFLLNHATRYGCLVFHARHDGIPLRLIEHHDFFSRDGLYDNGYTAYPDNALRFAFLCKAALEQCLQEGWAPDIVHCNDWQTALAAYYLKEHYPHDPVLKHTRSVLTVHNGAFQGKTEAKWLDGLGISWDRFAGGQVEHNGLVNLLKSGILSADKINAVSPGYAKELLAKASSHELWYCYTARHHDFTGILNGCDYTMWNPEKDPYLPHRFSADNLKGKHLCKKNLQQRMGLPQRKEVPIFGMISRLTDQKGFDYLIPAMEQVLNQGSAVQFVLLGSGNPVYASRLHHLQNRHREKMSFVNGYDVALSHLIEAGSDFFMMPSLFEPCGLNQLYSLAYGTLPVIRSTGGLKDTVVALSHDFSNADQATGIDFNAPDTYHCSEAIHRAMALFNNHKAVYDRLQQTAMGQLFTWDMCAAEYEALYHEAFE